MQLKAPDWSALAKKSDAGSLTATTTVSAVTRVMINISGPEMLTQVRIWTLRDTGYRTGVPPLPPAEFVFDNVKRGSNRLVQVLAIIQDIDTTATEGSSDGPMKFYYGDASQAFTKDVENVPVTLASQGTATGHQGNISGRFLDVNGVGPTGTLNMYYAPAGRPEMVVDTSTVFSGFFDLGLPAEMPFSYRMEGGQTLFDKITIDSLGSLIGAQRMRIEIPQGYNDQNGSRSLRNQRTNVIGFFGPGAPATNKVCFSPTSEPLQNLYTSATAGSTTRVSWNPSSASTADARIIGGGVSGAGLVCPGGVELGADYFALRVQSLAYGDSPIAIRGPFTEVTAGASSFVQSSLSGTNLNLTWKYVPATIGDSVGGVGIFTKTLAATESSNQWHDHTPCSALVSKFGFKEVTRVAAGTKAAPLETYTIQNVDTTAYSSGKLATFICPYSASGVYYDYAIQNYSGGGGAQLQATKLVTNRVFSPNVYSGTATRTQVAEATCTPISVRMTDAAGNSGFRAGATGVLQVQAALTAGTGALIYTDNQCSSGGATTYTANHNGTQFLFWVKVDNTSSQFDITFTDVTAGGSPLTTTTFLGQRTGSGSATQIKAKVPVSVGAYDCFEVMYTMGTDLGSDFLPLTGSDSISYSPMVSAQPGLTFHYDNFCGSQKSVDTLYSAMSSVSVWAKYTGPLTSINLAPIGTTLAPLAANVTVVQPGVASAIEFMMPTTGNAESCSPVSLRSVDANKRGAPAVTQAIVSFSYNGSPTPPANGGAYSDPSCTVPISTMTVEMGSIQSGQFYFRWPTTGAMTLAGTSSNSQTVTAQNIAFGPAGLGMLIATIPEVTWSFGGGFVGFGPQRVAHSIGLFSVTIRAVTPLGSPFTSFTESNVNNLGISDQYGELAVCGSYSGFTGGVATAGCYFNDSAYGVAYRSQLRAGGGSTPYPSFNSNYDQFMLVDPAESANGSTHFLSRPTSYYSNTCQPVMAQRRFNNTVSLPATTVLGLALTANSYVSAFYADPLCSGGTIMSADIPPGQSEKVVYMKMSGSGPPNPIADGVQLTDPYTFAVPAAGASAAPGAATGYTLTAERITVKGACEPVMVVRTDVNGAAVVAPSTVTLTVSQSGMNASFFSSPDCSSGSTTNVFALNTGESAKVIYYRPLLDTGSGGQINVIDNAGTPLSGVMGTMTVYP